MPVVFSFFTFVLVNRFIALALYFLYCSLLYCNPLCPSCILPVLKSALIHWTQCCNIVRQLSRGIFNMFLNPINSFLPVYNFVLRFEFLLIHSLTDLICSTQCK